MSIDRSLARWKRERASLQDQLELLESGRMTTGETRLGSAPIDDTPETIEEVRRKIAELDSVLARTNV